MILLRDDRIRHIARQAGEKGERGGFSAGRIDLPDDAGAVVNENELWVPPAVSRKFDLLRFTGSPSAMMCLSVRAGLRSTSGPGRARSYASMPQASLCAGAGSCAWALESIARGRCRWNRPCR